jgi:hypothetical protein
MNLVHKVGGIADAHERTPRVHVVLPTIDFLVVLEGEVIPLVLGLKQKTVRLQVYPLDIRDVAELNDGLRWRVL